MKILDDERGNLQSIIQMLDQKAMGLFAICGLLLGLLVVDVWVDFLTKFFLLLSIVFSVVALWPRLKRMGKDTSWMTFLVLDRRGFDAVMNDGDGERREAGINQIRALSEIIGRKTLFVRLGYAMLLLAMFFEVVSEALQVFFG